MINTIIAILLLITFAGFIFYIIKGGDLTIGFFVMAILWTVIGLIPYHTAITAVFSTPALKYGSTIIYIVFGSWFGRVLVESGIAPSISQKTNKVGKSHPLLAAILIVLVTALLFVSSYGVGSVIAIGVILLPILLSLGIPRDVALTTFALSIGSAMYVNVVLFNQIKAFFPRAQYNLHYLEFGWAAMAVQLIAVILFLVMKRHTFNPKNAEANLKEIGATDPGDVNKIPYIAYAIPVVPVILNMALGWDAIPALILSSILAMLVTGKMNGYKKFKKFLNTTIKQSINDISGLIMFLMALVMFAGAAQLNAGRFKGIFSAILPNSHLLLALGIGILAPLALFRGPLQVWGAGAATAAVLSATGMFNDMFLLPLMYVPTLMAVSTDITQSWNVWGLDYMKVRPQQLLKLGVPIMWIVSIINEMLVYLFFG